MAKHITQSVKDLIIKQMKEGAKVSELSDEHGVSANTIYGWTRASADNSGSSALEVSRLKREIHDLKLLVGALSLEKSRGEKNTAGPRSHARR